MDFTITFWHVSQIHHFLPTLQEVCDTESHIDIDFEIVSLLNTGQIKWVDF